MDDSRQTLSQKAAALASEQPPFWEFRLYAQVLIDEIALIQHVLAAPTPATRQAPRFKDTTAWMSAQLDALNRLVEEAPNYFNSSHDDAFGAREVAQTRLDEQVFVPHRPVQPHPEHERTEEICGD